MADKTTGISTLASTIKEAIDARLKELHTCLPGVIVSFDSVAQTASVQLAIKRMFKTDDGEKEVLVPTNIPPLINVPVEFPRGGSFSITLPVAVGNECLVKFAERSIDNWHQFSGVKSPGARRFHAFSDAICCVGLSSLPNKIPSFDPVNMQLKRDDGTVVMTFKTDGTVHLHADTKITLDAPLTDVTGDFNVQGDTTLDEVVKSKNVDISYTHIHPQGNDSDGDSQQNTGGPV